MFNKLITEKFKNIVYKSSYNELLWMLGYIQGYICRNKKIKKKITILYGTETGNSKTVADKLFYNINNLNKNIDTKIYNLKSYNIENLKNEENVFFIISTHGNGQPPKDSKLFFTKIKKIDNLSNIKFSICALGDKNYPNFCKAGIDMNNILISKNSKEIYPIVKCDSEFEYISNKWIDDIINIFF